MKTRKLKLLDPMRDGKGVEKGEDTTPNLKFFFKQLGRKFWKLVSINLIMLVQIIPFLLILLLQTAGPKEPTVSNPLYVPLLGAQYLSPTSAGATLLSWAGTLSFELDTYNTPIHFIIGALLVLHVLTYGWQKVGSTYLMRNLVRGDGVFIVSDFFYAIKRNFKQGFILGLLDCIFCGVLYIDIMYFTAMPVSGFSHFLYITTIALIIIYLAMRWYMYLLLVTFNIKISKIFKNSLIFAVLGIKRNLMAALGIGVLVALVIALNLLLFQINLYVGIIIPFLFFLAVAAFIYTYAAYPVVKRYMIDPTPAKNTPSNEAETEVNTNDATEEA
ncbi:MAG: DUF624 domain-containing protein [Clostridia bacterium]|nr:DUF624 domain-containing protein [Clostridia bacterium]